MGRKPGGTKTGGRQAGSLNKTSSELKARLQELIDAEMDSGKIHATLALLDGKDYMNAIKDILPYLVSKAPQDLNVNSDGFVLIKRRNKDQSENE